jgi:hypothetical protein
VVARELIRLRGNPGQHAVELRQMRACRRRRPGHHERSRQTRVVCVRGTDGSDRPRDENRRVNRDEHLPGS